MAKAIEEFRGRTPDQLQDNLLDLKREQFNLRFQAATGQLEKSHRVNEVRKSIARIKSLLEQKVVSQAEYDQRLTQVQAARQQYQPTHPACNVGELGKIDRSIQRSNRSVACRPPLRPCAALVVGVLSPKHENIP